MITIECNIYPTNPGVIDLPILQDRLIPSIYYFENKRDSLRIKETRLNATAKSNCSRSLIRRVQDRSNYNRCTKIHQEE